MELMSLLAKITVDKKEFDEKIEQAQETAENFTGPDTPDLDLDTTDFDTKVAEAEKEKTSLGQTIKSKLELAIDKFKSNVDTAKEKSQEIIQKVSDLTGLTPKLIGDMATSIVQTGINEILKKIASDVNAALELVRVTGLEISQNADKLGITTKAYQEWEHALDGTGMKVTDLSDGIENVNALLYGSASDDAAAAFKQLGISATDVNGDLKSTESLLSEVIYALANMEEGAERTNLEKALFGTSGKSFDALLNKGAIELKSLKREMDESTSFMNDHDIEVSINYNNAIENFNTSIENLKSLIQEGLGTSIIGPLTSIVEGITKVIEFFDPNIKKAEKSTDSLFASIDRDSERSTLAIETSANQAEVLIDKLTALGPATQQTAEQHELWVKYAGQLEKLVPSLKGSLDEEKGVLEKENGILKDNVKQWAERQKQLIIQQAFADKEEILADRLKKATEAQWEATLTRDDADLKRVEAITNANKILRENEELAYKYASNNFGNQYLSFDENNAPQLSLDTDLDTLDDFLLALQIWGSYDESDPFEKILEEQDELVKKADEQQKEADKLNEEYKTQADKLEKLREVAGDMYAATEDSADNATESVNELGDAINALPDTKYVDIVERIYQEGSSYNGGTGAGAVKYTLHAKGAWDIPYDNYPAMLHRNEMVLTASQARQYREGNNDSSVDVAGLANAMTSAVRQGMNGATVNSYLNGRSINTDMNKETIRQVKARRFAT